MIAINTGLLGYLLRIQGNQQTDFARQQCAALIKSLSEGKQLADEADLAGDRIEIEMERIMSAFKPATGESLTECEACGNDIPEERQQAVQGCTLCIACAEVRELMGRARRG